MMIILKKTGEPNRTFESIYAAYTAFDNEIPDDWKIYNPAGDELDRVICNLIFRSIADMAVRNIWANGVGIDEGHRPIFDVPPELFRSFL